MNYEFKSNYEGACVAYNMGAVKWGSGGNEFLMWERSEALFSSLFKERKKERRSHNKDRKTTERERAEIAPLGLKMSNQDSFMSQK